MSPEWPERKPAWQELIRRAFLELLAGSATLVGVALVVVVVVVVAVASGIIREVWISAFAG